MMSKAAANYGDFSLPDVSCIFGLPPKFSIYAQYYELSLNNNYEYSKRFLQKWKLNVQRLLPVLRILGFSRTLLFLLQVPHALFRKHKGTTKEDVEKPKQESLEVKVSEPIKKESIAEV